MKEFRFHQQPGEFADASIVVDQRYQMAYVSCAPDCEADLALCLAALVKAGAINVEKLRAMLVLAEPVATEKVAEAKAHIAAREKEWEAYGG